MLAVLKLDVTSVKRPLMIIITMITAARGIPAKKLSACATLIDSFETWKEIETCKFSIFIIHTNLIKENKPEKLTPQQDQHQVELTPPMAYVLLDYSNE